MTYLLLSMLLFQVTYFGLCLPGFLAQYLPFMQRFKVQQVKIQLFISTCCIYHCPLSHTHIHTHTHTHTQDKPETFPLQWKCFRKLMFNHFCIQVYRALSNIFHPLPYNNNILTLVLYISQLPMMSGAYFYLEFMGIPYEYEYIPPWSEL